VALGKTDGVAYRILTSEVLAVSGNVGMHVGGMEETRRLRQRLAASNLEQRCGILTLLYFLTLWASDVGAKIRNPCPNVAIPAGERESHVVSPPAHVSGRLRAGHRGVLQTSP